MKTIFKSLIIISILLVSLSISAKEKVIFYCKTDKINKIKVFDDGKNIRYFYGTPQSNISFETNRDLVSTNQWIGLGNIIYSINIPINNEDYKIFYSVDRNSDNHYINSGVDILSNNRNDKIIRCLKNTVKQSIEYLDLKLGEE